VRGAGAGLGAAAGSSSSSAPAKPVAVGRGRGRLDRFIVNCMVGSRRGAATDDAARQERWAWCSLTTLRHSF
jgi:hypothetical protein